MKNFMKLVGGLVFSTLFLAGCAAPMQQEPPQYYTNQGQPMVNGQQGLVGGNTTVVPAKCDFGDGVVVYTYEGKRGCDKIAAKMSKKVPSSSAVAKVGSTQEQTSSEPVRAVVPAERKAVNGVDLWKWRNGLASASNPLPCVVEKLTGEGKPHFCSEMKTLAKKDGETRTQWALRAEKL